MHFSSRSVAVLLLTAAAAACSDTRTINTPIPPGKHAGRLAVNPVFSSAAKTISASLADFGITFDRVRITVRNEQDTTITVADTTVTFGPSSNALTLDLTVPVDVDGQVFNVLVQYIGPSGPVYAGTLAVKSHPADQQAPEQQSLVLSFVGPGAKLKTISVSPDPVQLVGTQSVPVTITATDSSGATIALPPLVFTSTDESVAKVNGTATNRVVESFGKRGQVLLTATTPIGISDTLSAVVSLPASKMVVVSGGNQTGTVGAALANPLIVQVNADDDVGVAGVAVTFAAPVGGSVGTATATTDANGRASTTMTLATGAGAQGFLATAAGVNLPISQTAVAGPASAATSTISSSAVQINADNASPATVTVQTKDQYGNVITKGGATVTLTTSLGHWGTAGSATTVTATDAGNGTYTAQLFSAQSGTATITGTVGGTAIVTTGPTVNMVATLLDHFDVTDATDKSLAPSQPAGTPISLHVTAKDASGNVITSYTGQPSLGITGSTFFGGTPTPPSAVNGVSTVSVRFGAVGTGVTVSASGTQGQVTKTGSSAAFNVVAGPPALIVPARLVQPSIDSTVVVYDRGGELPSTYPAVRILDAAGNPVSGRAVTFSLPAGSKCALNSPQPGSSGADGIVSLSAQSLTMPISGADFDFSCQLIAAASGYTAPSLRMAIIVQQIQGTTAWTGRLDNSWETRDNWTFDTPSSSMNAFIPAAQPRATPVIPQLKNDVFLQSVDVEEAALLDLNGHTMSLYGNADARTGAIINGTLTLSGQGAIRGALPTVNCQYGSYSLTGLTQIADSLALTNQCSLDVAGQTLSVLKNFSTSGGGRLAMTQPSSSLLVVGTARFAGGSEAEQLTAGTLVVLGDFIQSGDGYSFAPSGSHSVSLGAGSTQNQSVTFSDVTNSGFQNLGISLATGKTVTINSPVRVAGTLSVVGLNDGGTLSLPSGLNEMQNGPIEVAGSVTINLGGTVNTSSLTFGRGNVTLTGNGSISLASGSLRLDDGLHLTINVTGSVVSGPPESCQMAPTVIIDGSNQAAVDALKLACSSR